MRSEIQKTQNQIETTNELEKKLNALVAELANLKKAGKNASNDIYFYLALQEQAAVQRQLHSLDFQ